jgi:hypothetical protein
MFRAPGSSNMMRRSFVFIAKTPLATVIPGGGYPSWYRNNPVYPPIAIANRHFKKLTKIIRNRLKALYI